MDQNQILERITGKIARLGDAKKELESQISRLRDENAAMNRINKELQAQVDELIRKNNEMVNARSLQVPPDEEFRGATRQRINELVKEIDECLTLLNK
jgi:predicted RNase H-like nuclease (RuvC/YqgF family)